MDSHIREDVSALNMRICLKYTVASFALIALYFVLEHFRLGSFVHILLILGILGSCLSVIQILKSWRLVRRFYRVALFILLVLSAGVPVYAVYFLVTSL